MEKNRRPYGLWDSPITSEQLAMGVRLTDVRWDSDGETLIWMEERSDRGVLVAKRRGQGARDLTAELSVRARVGYGGGDFTVAQGIVYFVSNGKIYRQPLAAGAARPITPAFGEVAAPTVSPDGRWILFVHSDGVSDCLAICDTDGESWPQRIACDSDFYMQPCWHPDGDRIAWVSWDHPHMAWGESRLRMATLTTGGRALPTIEKDNCIVAKPDVSVFQPQFSPDGTMLVFVSDESGFGNLAAYDLGTEQMQWLTSGDADISLPAWEQGERTYEFSHDGREVLYVARKGGRDLLRRHVLATGDDEDLGKHLAEYTHLAQISTSPTEDVIAVIAQATSIPARVVTCALRSGSRSRIHRFSATETTPADDLSIPETVTWRSKDGEKVHGLFYTPTNAAFIGDGEPPAIVLVHGGPTSQYAMGFNAETQFFTSRGYAVLEVNYRGSSGYGRKYRKALDGEWGVIDVEDTVSGARFLADSTRADVRRLVIMGGSAGGFTVLRCLTEHPGLFCAAVCKYGVSDLFGLAMATHKLELHYLDSLVGELPQASDTYRERSPIFSADRITDPIAVFQGEDDRVVPKEQSDRIVASLRRRGIAHEYHLYPGEGHGWRKTDTIAAFYSDVERFLREHVLFG